MAESAAFPYETRLNILFKPLELIDVLRFRAQTNTSGSIKPCAR